MVTIAAAAGALRAGETDPVALARATLDAAHASQTRLNAFVTIDDEGALAAARRARGELARGVDRGPLHGVPVAVKDLIDTAGLETTMGSRHFAGHVPERDATVVARLREAGAVIVGKTTTHEFAYGPTGDRAANGPGRNPHDPQRMAGGSSAGSAAAVAAGIVPLALGTDTGGSVRIPAALCGVAGLRPTSGAVPVDGVFPLSPSLDAVGPIAATIEDLAVGWAVLAGRRPDAPPPPPPAHPRLGLVDAEALHPVDAPVAAALRACADRLEGELVPVPLPDARELLAVYATVQSFEAARIHAERLARAPELFDPEVLERLRAAATVTAARYAEAAARLSPLRRTAADRLDGLDALLLPTAPILAPRLGARDAVRAALLALTSPWSVLGLPAVSVPLATPGLPVGAQLVGRPGGEDALLAVARAIAAP